jgi:hypothetical protein
MFVKHLCSIQSDQYSGDTLEKYGVNTHFGPYVDCIRSFSEFKNYCRHGQQNLEPWMLIQKVLVRDVARAKCRRYHAKLPAQAQAQPLGEHRTGSGTRLLRPRFPSSLSFAVVRPRKAAAKWTGLRRRLPTLRCFFAVLVWVTIVFAVDSSIWYTPPTFRKRSLTRWYPARCCGNLMHKMLNVLNISYTHWRNRNG